MRNATIVFLIKMSGDHVVQLLLAMKKRGFGVGRWNGVGGKVKAEETIEEAAVREAKEEIGVKISRHKLSKVAVFNFIFSANPDWSQQVHVFFAKEWDGEPSESEEMAPCWYTPNLLPFHAMWVDDQYWLPRVLSGELLRGSFTFGEGDTLLEHALTTIDNF